MIFISISIKTLNTAVKKLLNTIEVISSRIVFLGLSVFVFILYRLYE